MKTILYILSNGYVGVTKDLVNRLIQHSKNKNVGAELVHYWILPTRFKALSVEYYLQTLSINLLWELIQDCPVSITFLYEEAKQLIRTDKLSARYSRFKSELHYARRYAL